MLKGKKILLGVSGGIAAYKAASLASLLVRRGCDVETVMTENAERIIGAAVFEALTRHRVYDSVFDHSDPSKIPHIALAEGADALVIAPATADIIAKAACGLADDMLSTVILPCTCPKIVVPAMNTRMYDNAATQENLQTLRRRRWIVMEPAEGHLACGETGRGKMPEPEDIADFIDMTIGHEKDMSGQRVLVTAGPTCEAIDPVRYITNHSTGRMGYAVAKAAAMRGAKVTLVSGPTELKTPPLTERVDVRSAREMFDAVTSRFADSSIVVMSAAVADYRPATVAENKIKKSDGALTLQLARTQDILKYLGEHRTGQIICGFSMETEKLIENSRAKLAKKHVQMIAANSLKVPGAGFGTDTNVLTLITADSTVELPLMSKEEAAHRLLDEIMKMKPSTPRP
ncbi:MAG: bifunctional phosphopantothenoylcysteine decarboxylase/phosphopantothenate--cysteine ligase CoaBC [Pyramidobacter sp.]|jgi:phosphopantothenoylcysteine decarboxylase/phosphopantothenate--cysteine ligase